MKTQEYLCEKCGLKSYIFHDDHADVMTVFYMIADDHKEKSPVCTQSINFLKLIVSSVDFCAQRLKSGL